MNSQLLSGWSKTNGYYDKYSDAERQSVRNRLASKLNVPYARVSKWTYPQVVNLGKLWKKYPHKVARDFNAGVFERKPLNSTTLREAKAAEYASQPPVMNKKSWVMPAIGIGGVVVVGGLVWANKNKTE